MRHLTNNQWNPYSLGLGQFCSETKIGFGWLAAPPCPAHSFQCHKKFLWPEKNAKVFTFTHNNSTARIPILPNIENHFWLHPYKRGKDWFNLDIRSFRALCFCIQGLVPLGLCVRFWKMKTVKDLINREFGAEWTCRTKSVYLRRNAKRPSRCLNSVYCSPSPKLSQLSIVFKLFMFDMVHCKG